MSRVRIACRCAWCNGVIEDGELCFEYDDELFHEECFNENAVELLKEKGARLTIAESEEEEV